MIRILPRKRFLKRLAIGIGLVVAILLLANAFLAWRFGHRLQAKIDRLRAAGDPATLADLTPAAIPDERNAAAIMARMRPELDAFGKDHMQFYETPEGKALTKREDDDLPPETSQLARMGEILEKHQVVLAGLAAAAGCNEYVSKLDFTLPPRQFMDVLLPHATHIRTVARYVGWKTSVLNAAGKQDESVRLAIQVLRLARLYDHEPMLIHYLVSIAVRGVAVDMLNTTLRSGPVSPEVRAELESELVKQDSERTLPRALRSERAYAISATMEQTGVVPAAFRWPMSGFYWRELEVLDKGIDSADKPWHTVRAEWDDAYAREKQQYRLAGLKEQSLIGEAMRAAFWADAGRLTMARCLRILNALQKFRNEKGHEATTLDELGLPAEAVIDPWSGKPLRIKMTDRGWLVYSAWRNGTYEDGRMNYMEGDWGLWPAGYPHEP